MINNINCLALLKLAYCPFLGPKNIQYLENKYQNLDDIFIANEKNFLDQGWALPLVEKFIYWRKTINLEKILFDLDKENIKFITWHDTNYPYLLKQIYNPPSILFYKGELLNNLKKDYLALAIVGSRENTYYGEKVINYLLPDLIKHNIIIVSGLAIGIDYLAHKITLANQGKTIAVLGSGLKESCFYPKQNLHLAKEILNNQGLLLTEFPPNEVAKKQNFPRRNRLISGLSQATLIIEAKIKSGSLITANFALDQGREVLAIPGNIFLKTSLSTNNLIKEGAIPITDSQDVLKLFKIYNYPNNKTNKLKILNTYQAKNKIENTIINIIKKYNLGGEDINVNDLIIKTKLDSAQINSTLTILELNKIIHLENGYVKLNF